MRFLRFLLPAASALSLNLAGLAGAQTVASDAPTLDAGMRAAIVDSISAVMSQIYVFPDVAEEMEQKLRDQLAAGRYDKLDSPPAFAEKLTEDLQSISHDKHLQVDPISPRMRQWEPTDDDPEAQARQVARQRATNFGFNKIERLTGNVGYLDLRGFLPAEVAGATAVAAMNFLANSDAIIIDLRQNGGGSPSMIQLISSYFFAEPTHLNSFYIRREDSMKQFWTQAHIDGPSLVDVPLYVLTSPRTFSAAEEFTYNMRNLERATIVGETTGGGAHPVDFLFWEELHIAMSLPFGRAVNPISGTNWEGTGVAPHVEVPAASALAAAHHKAIEGLLEGELEPDRAYTLEWAKVGLQAQLHPVELDKKAMKQIAGDYGPRKIRLDDGALYYHRDGGPEHRLYALGEDLLGVEGVDFFRIRLERDAKGKVQRLIGLYEDGHQDANDRS